MLKNTEEYRGTLSRKEKNISSYGVKAQEKYRTRPASDMRSEQIPEIPEIQNYGWAAEGKI